MENINLFQLMPKIAGMKIGTSAAEIKYQKRKDLALFTFAKGTSIAGVYTKSSIVSETINWTRKVGKKGKARALIVNSGNANCFTGYEGKLSIYQITEELAIQLGCKPDEIAVASTGVIGEKLPFKKIINKIPECLSQDDTIEDAAKAIMTTDTKPKFICKYTHIGGVPITINVIAKGSGMAAPNMATILSFLFTDAKIPADILQELLSKSLKNSFNAITIDNDTSTNDMLLAFATGKAKAHKKITSAKDPALKDFAASIQNILTEIAKKLVTDAEGAQKFVEINVTGAKSAKSAEIIAKSIANSPLVKTAINGCDPNWGRIIMAVGKSLEPVVQDKLKLKIGDQLIVDNGEINPDYNEENSTKPYMQNKNISIFVDIGFPQKNNNKATIWTSDLSKEYIEINADYRS